MQNKAAITITATIYAVALTGCAAWAIVSNLNPFFIGLAWSACMIIGGLHFQDSINNSV